MKLSIVIPVYNEKDTLLSVIAMVQQAPLPKEITEKEIILVNDASTDGTGELMNTIATDNIIICHHEKNYGKGRALASGFARASGDLVLIQDADMEYNPEEYPQLLRPFIDNMADVVYGSRYRGGERHRILYFWHTMGNKFLTTLSNMFSNLYLSDMETCYKVFRRKMLEGIHIEESRFGFEPEITAKIASIAHKKKLRIYEVGISYTGRSYDEGKKIGWKDGFRALWCILKYNTTTFAKLVRYLFSGLLVGTSQLLALTLLMEFPSMPQNIAQENINNIIAIEISFLVAFILHRRFTWRRSFEKLRQKMLAFLAFHGASLFSLSIRLVLFYLLSRMKVNYLINASLGIAAAISINFITYNKIFKESP